MGIESQAWAIRPLITDDARVVGERAAQIETWIRVDEGGPQHWTVFAVGPLKPLELSAGGFYGSDDRHFTAAAPTIQLKALALEPKAGAILPGVAVVAGIFGPVGTGPLRVRGWDSFGYIALTESLDRGDRVLVHQNVGVVTTHDSTLGGKHDIVTWGVGTQVRIAAGFHFVGEIFSGDPYSDSPGGAFQVGGRQFVSSHVQVDATVGRGIFGETILPVWGSLGLRFASDPDFW
ncbi:hypothetical protein LZC95_48745 [Pendulispora brunnea]|uniref:Uncharacterized protein n=1 Tax=Pendulispora brunnea TaxID=2905690 RepID=A0ABZ2K6K4_9BACT